MDAVGEGAEGWDLRAVDGGEEGVEAALGFVAAGGAVDAAKRFLQAPCLGDQWLVREQFAELSALLCGEALVGRQQPVPGVKEILAPAGLAALSRALGTACACLALAVAAHAVQRRIGTADEVEVVDDDPGPRQLGSDRLPVGVLGVDRDDRDGAAIGLREAPQVALYDASAAAIEDIQDAATVEV